jgi:hypothetical protein
MRKIVFFSPLLVATAIMLLKHAGGSKEIYVVFECIFLMAGCLPAAIDKSG